MSLNTHICACVCACVCVRRGCAKVGFGFRDFRIYYICIYVYIDVHMKNMFFTCICGYTCLATLLANYSAGMCAKWGLGCRDLRFRFSKRDHFECRRDVATNLMRSLSNRMRLLTNRMRPLTNIMRNL